MVLFLAQLCSQLFDGLRGDHSVRTDGEAVAPFLCMSLVSVKGICHCGIGVGVWDWHYLSITWVPDLTARNHPYICLFSIAVCKICHELLPEICIQQHTASGMHCNTWSIKVLHMNKNLTSLKRRNLCIVSGLDFSCLAISKCIKFSFAKCQVTVELGNVSRAI